MLPWLFLSSAALWLSACAATGPPSAAGDASPFVRIESVDDSIARDIRYARSANFVGEPIDGYEAARCLLTPPAARALGDVQRDLALQGLGLLVFDCYRPQRAVDRFVRWADEPDDPRSRARYYPHLAKAELFERGYIATRSSHSRGSTVDVALVEAGGRAAKRRPLDMGSPFDFFDPRSHTEAAGLTGAQRANRLRLREAMERRGFRNFPKEWWHFTLENEPHPDRSFDLPIR